jgi:hypothetical protein
MYESEGDIRVDHPSETTGYSAATWIPVTPAQSRGGSTKQLHLLVKGSVDKGGLVRQGLSSYVRREGTVETQTRQKNWIASWSDSLLRWITMFRNSPISRNRNTSA